MTDAEIPAAPDTDELQREYLLRRRERREAPQERGGCLRTLINGSLGTLLVGLLIFCLNFDVKVVLSGPPATP